MNETTNFSRFSYLESVFQQTFSCSGSCTIPRAIFLVRPVQGHLKCLNELFKGSC